MYFYKLIKIQSYAIVIFRASTSNRKFSETHKWDIIFQQYYTQLGISYKDNYFQDQSRTKIWQSISVFMVNCHMENTLKSHSERIDKRKKYDDLETIPNFGMEKLNLEEIGKIKAYLNKVFLFAYAYFIKHLILKNIF